MEAPHGHAATPPPADEHASSEGRLTRMLHWATGSKLRKAIAALTIFTLLGGSVAAFSLFEQWAEEVVERDYVQLALKSLDEGKYADAKSMIGQMQQQPASPRQLASALYVLGVVKANEADQEAAASRRRAMHEIAARYLKKALKLDLDETRHGQANFLLGRSLVRSGQTKDAIRVLEESLLDSKQPTAEIHALLVTAHLDGKEPDFKSALRHNEEVLADQQLTDEKRQRATLISAEAMLRLGRRTAARELLQQLKATGVEEANRVLMLARIDLDDAEELPVDSRERTDLLQRAQIQLQQVAQLDTSHDLPTRQAALWIARYFELSNDHDAAAAEYAKVAKVYPGTAAGLTAALAAADYHRRNGRLEKALVDYKLVLHAIDAQEGYDDSLLPVEDLRDRMKEAFDQCIEQRLYPEALTLVDLFHTVFGETLTTEMRARTHDQWGQRQLEQATVDPLGTETLRLEGRKQLREAGRAYEALARLRFASRQFVDDLWNAAESYFNGQSYTNAARVYAEYLHHESRRRNPLALLRLGQSELAARKFDLAVEALSECVEMYPLDPVAYQARLEAARAYEKLEKPAEAEKMLVTNLVEDVLTPASPEWRDSLFELGTLLYQQKRYDESIKRLDEAVKRYPEAKETLLARYTIGRAYHAAAEEPAKRLAESKTENERLNARTQMTELLIKAHENYLNVQRTLTLGGGDASDPMQQTLLRNCYMLQGSVLFELRRFEEALKAYGNVITSYQSDPIAMESFLQAAACWRRLDQPVKARVTLDQAKLVLKEMPPTTDFRTATNFTRTQWEYLLNQMSLW
ncbi:tetratricopeptide repeat protein [Lacipirellula sp.]|uniref:tetratricopeptide repeat protein n=1 Tax=Lacipirellula sp. TaxID=2691419 RepID=UPI003D0F2E3C